MLRKWGNCSGNCNNDKDHTVKPQPQNSKIQNSMTSASPEPSAKLPLPAKLAFGAGDMGAGLTANLVVFSFLVFLTTVAGLSPGWASTVLLIGKIWDAFTDPIVGLLSDRTRYRWGRRHSWMLFGSIPFGISFALMWVVPNVESATLKFIYYVVVSIIFFTSYTAVNLPYAALTPELTQDYDERTSLNSFRLSFSLGGAVFGLMLGLIISNWVKDAQWQYIVIGITGAIVAVLPLYWCIFGTRPHLNLSEGASSSSSKSKEEDGRQEVERASQNSKSQIQNPSTSTPSQERGYR